LSPNSLISRLDKVLADLARGLNDYKWWT